MTAWDYLDRHPMFACFLILVLSAFLTYTLRALVEALVEGVKSVLRLDAHLRAQTGEESEEEEFEEEEEEEEEDEEEDEEEELRRNMRDFVEMQESPKAEMKESPPGAACMRTHLYTPQWRLRDPTVVVQVELVERPDREWFTDKEHIRFALMSDGRLFFGDGMTVLHHDICQAYATSLGGAPTRAILVGVLMKKEEVWQFANAQEFMQGTSEDALTNARYLLAALKDWKEVAAAMGNDPVHQPGYGTSVEPGKQLMFGDRAMEKIEEDAPKVDP